MSLGDTIIVDGIEMEVVWSGGQELLGDRESHGTGVWQTTNTRLYNKTGKHKGKFKRAKKKPLDNLDKASDMIDFMGEN